MSWFSARIRLACLIEGVGLSRFMDSVFVFRADDFKAAMRRALELGRHQEEEYLNGEKERVRWRFKEIVSLDAIDREDLDGVEVYSESVESDEVVDFDVQFRPETSEPGQTI